jgi:hypothetical protein
MNILSLLAMPLLLPLAHLFHAYQLPAPPHDVPVVHVAASVSNGVYAKWMINANR